MVDRLKTVAYGVEVVALQLAQVIAHTKPGYGMLQELREPLPIDLEADGQLVLGRHGDDGRVGRARVGQPQAEAVVGIEEVDGARGFVAYRGYGMLFHVCN